MGKESSVAPKERVNIVYKPATGDNAEEVELPLRVLMMGDYTLRPDDTPIENRKSVQIDKDNFNEVLAKHNIGMTATVPDKLSNEPNKEMSVSLKFKSIRDFEPQGIVDQVPELRKLLELRQALVSLRSPLTDRRSFRQKIQNLLSDAESREKLMTELGLSRETKS